MFGCSRHQLNRMSEVIGAVYVMAEMENVFEQMDEINNIFITGTAIALGDYGYPRNFPS